VTTDGNSRRALWTPDGLGVTFDRRYGSDHNAFLLSASAEHDAAATQITHGTIQGYGSGGGWIGNDFSTADGIRKRRATSGSLRAAAPKTARPLIVGEGIQWGRPSPDGR
jgi:hypothetical protein